MITKQQLARKYHCSVGRVDHYIRQRKLPPTTAFIVGHKVEAGWRDAGGVTIVFGRLLAENKYKIWRMRDVR